MTDLEKLKAKRDAALDAYYAARAYYAALDDALVAARDAAYNAARARYNDALAAQAKETPDE